MLQQETPRRELAPPTLVLLPLCFHETLVTMLNDTDYGYRTENNDDEAYLGTKNREAVIILYGYYFTSC